ncbi:MAG TPA: hypothetical protein VGG39_34690 [Polyangiaceae bacterium]|jgi:hypothetical protein
MAPERSVSEVKGLWFTVGRRYVLESHGEEALATCVARLGDRHGPVFADPLPSAWYPEETLQQTLGVLGVVIAGGESDRYVRIIEDCSLLAVHHFFRALLRLVPPATMLRKVPTMWGLIRRGAGRVVVDADETHALVRYSEFPYFDDLNYRLLTLGAIRSLMTLCGARNARVELGTHTADSLNVAVTY